MTKNGYFVFSGVNNIAFSGINTLFYITLACKIILVKNCNSYLAKFGHNMAKNGYFVFSVVNNIAFTGIATPFLRKIGL